MSERFFLGIDPGSSSGAMSIITDDLVYVDTVFLKETTQDVADWVLGYSDDIVFAALERVGAMPRQGVSSTFKFGASFGKCEMVLAALKIRHTLVSPAVWQKSLECRTGGDKSITKKKAQQLWPNIKITNNMADSILLALYARNHPVAE